MCSPADESRMRLAIAQAELAAGAGEIPVGAILTDGEGNILSSTHNLCEAQQLATAHAEMLAIAEASKKKGTWRLSDCTLYVTMEPCPMCMGAIIHARIGRVVYGVKDARAGACGSLLDLNAYPLESAPKITQGVLEQQCRDLLRAFFLRRRGNKQN